MGGADFPTFIMSCTAEQMVAMLLARCLVQRRTTAAIDVSLMDVSNRLGGRTVNTVPQCRVCTARTSGLPFVA
jgi:hypothetical protein